MPEVIRFAIPQSYGDLAGALDVSYRTRTGFGNASAVGCGHEAAPDRSGLEFWNTGYSDLTGVAFACNDQQVAEILLSPLGGGTVGIGSMDFGSHPASAGLGPVRPCTLRTHDGAWNEPFGQALEASTTIDVAANLSSSSGLYIQWGSDWNVGIDDLEVTVRGGTPSVVPEPSTYALLATGLGVLAGVARRRRSRPT